ncbi:nucleolar protein [Malassezia pachydermatis]|uniref:Nop15-protein involved in 60s ribosomal subunit biogenesis n=1 Tax=Malassezia pachydermatis TaxID=77020 RepID=A0A0M8MLT2_9BASI|nr:nop15-protein involved in 60s ribosomal subunit biogenesis [Malassezia pachydermatis]KOS12697.1 nop15-protein involved in 60s ribosomal subunit biogenesis [Malassezia pachydermatis]
MVREGNVKRKATTRAPVAVPTGIKLKSKTVKEDPVKLTKKKSTKEDVSAAPVKKKTKSVRISENPSVVKIPARKTSTKKSKVVPLATTVEDEDEDEGDEDEIALVDEDDDSEELEGFPPMDSEDEDEEDDALAMRAAPTVSEVVRLPSSRDDVAVRQRLEKAKQKQAQNKDKEEVGVVYIGRLPHGFFEDQLKAYFEQFGDINRLRLSRNKKTGHSRHYGFMEFASADVAEIVVDTMNNYLLNGHLLQMSMIPPEKVDPNLWVGANRKFRRVPTDRIERVRRSKSRSAEARAKVNQKLLQRQKKRRAALERAGIEYDFPGYQ